MRRRSYARRDEPLHYVAVAADHRGHVTGEWRSRTVRGAMAQADAHAHPASRVRVNAAYTSDGTFWGEGKGRVMAQRERGRWHVEDYSDARTEGKAHGAPWTHTARAQRDAGLDKKALQKSIDADLKMQAKRKLRHLHAELKMAYRQDRKACGLAKHKAKTRIHRLRERRAALQAQIRRLAERERSHARHACGLTGKKSYVAKGRRPTCSSARTEAKRRLAKLRRRREHVPGLVRGRIAHERAMRNETCSTKRSVAARAKLREERNYQNSLKRSAAFARNRNRRPGLRKSAERRAESDDEVRHNIPPHLIGLFNRVRKGIKGSARKSRTEEFLEYVEEHPDEEYADADDATDALVADLERQMRSGRRDTRRPRYYRRGV